MAEYQYVNETGVIVPDTSKIQTDVQDEYRAVFGQDLVVTPNTPQGVLITAETLARSNVVANNAALANQINPNIAGGVFLDAIWALTGGQRLPATFTYIPGVMLSGLPGTIINVGAQAAMADGTLFASLTRVVLDSFGNGYSDFQAVTAGPVSVSVGALSQVVTAVLGWDTVTNPTVGVSGRNLESDLSARLRRKNTLGAQNVALPVAITSGVYGVDGVRSLTFRENVSQDTQTIDGVVMLPKSIFLCVDGGSDTAVAAAILANKSLGAAMNGTTSVNVRDAASGQLYPVQFSRPDQKPVQARLTVRRGSAIGDLTAIVQAAVLAYASGQIQGEPGFVVGGSVSPFELAGAVSSQSPGIYVLKCEVSLASPTAWTTDEIPVGITEIATITQGTIQVVIA